jgi:hypothetical protein
MDLTAATATADGLPLGTAAVALLAAVVIYAASCTWWPLAKCRCCSGDGRHSRRDGKVFRPCRWCRGSGRRWRIGRRVYNAIRARQRDAQ